MVQLSPLIFDDFAELYDKARPIYPDQVFADLKEACRIDENSRIVEVGCGTGQASAPLTKMCGSLTCVELGPQMADIARRNLKPFANTEVVCSGFEEWEAEGQIFDLAFCATAWHWLNPIRRYAKAHEVLRPGGYLAVLRNQHAFVEDIDPFFMELNSAYEQISDDKDSQPWPRPTPDQVTDDREEMVKTGHFEFVDAKRYLWQVDYTGDQFVGLLSTFSDHIALPKEKSDYLYSEVRRIAAKRPDGLIHKIYLSILQIAKAT